MRVCTTPTPPLPLFAHSLHEHVRRSSRRSACLRLFVSRKRSTLTPTHGRTSNFTHPGRTRRTPSTSSLSSRSSASPSARSFSCVVSPRLSFPCGALVCSFANSQRSKKLQYRWTTRRAWIASRATPPERHTAQVSTSTTGAVLTLVLRRSYSENYSRSDVEGGKRNERCSLSRSSTALQQSRGVVADSVTIGLSPFPSSHMTK